jgi:phosphoglycerate dehydrogenase-like enzyme
VLTIAALDSAVEAVRRRAAEMDLPLRVVAVSREGELADPSAEPEGVLRAAALQGRALSRLLQSTPSIRWIHTVSAGVDAVITPEVVERGIAVTRSRGLHDRTVSEFAMALILLAAKRLRLALELQQRREWQEIETARLAGATLAIVGYGEIGRALAARAKAFEMRVLGVRRQPGPDGVADEVVGRDTLLDVLARSEYVVLTAPLTPETRGMIGSAELRAMPARGYLVNVGRGELVDEFALDAALTAGHPAGALLDTFSTEPLPSDHPLWSNPRVVVTPHAAGIRQTSIHGPAMDQFLENARRFLNVEPLRNMVDNERGY